MSDVVDVDVKLPSWLRRYVCPQCPAHAQPPTGFDVTEFQEHVFSHAATNLREAAGDARHYRHGLEMIDAVVGEKSHVEWERSNVFGLRAYLRHVVETHLRQHDTDSEKRRDEIDADPRASDPLEERVSLRVMGDHAARVLALVTALPKCDVCGERLATRDALALRLCDECRCPDDENLGPVKDRSYAAPLRALLATRVVPAVGGA